MVERLTPEMIRRAAERMTKASAKLEGREMPEDYVRSEKVQALLDKLQADREDQANVQESPREFIHRRMREIAENKTTEATREGGANGEASDDE